MRKAAPLCPKGPILCLKPLLLTSWPLAQNELGFRKGPVVRLCRLDVFLPLLKLRLSLNTDVQKLQHNRQHPCVKLSPDPALLSHLEPLFAAQARHDICHAAHGQVVLAPKSCKYLFLYTLSPLPPPPPPAGVAGSSPGGEHP